LGVQKATERRKGGSVGIGEGLVWNFLGPNRKKQGKVWGEVFKESAR